MKKQNRFITLNVRVLDIFGKPTDNHMDVTLEVTAKVEKALMEAVEKYRNVEGKA